MPLIAILASAYADNFCSTSQESGQGSRRRTRKETSIDQRSNNARGSSIARALIKFSEISECLRNFGGHESAEIELRFDAEILKQHAIPPLAVDRVENDVMAWTTESHPASPVLAPTISLRPGNFIV
jgi:hypothetical protein